MMLVLADCIVGIALSFPFEVDDIMSQPYDRDADIKVFEESLKNRIVVPQDNWMIG